MRSIRVDAPSPPPQQEENRLQRALVSRRESDYRMSTLLIENGIGVAMTTYGACRQSAAFLRKV